MNAWCPECKCSIHTGDCSRAGMYPHHVQLQKPEPKQCPVIAIALHTGGNCCVLKEGHVGEHQTWKGDHFQDGINRWQGSPGPADVAKLLQCPAHKRYRAARKPTGTCEHCWRIWTLSHPNYELETRWQR